MASLPPRRQSQRRPPPDQVGEHTAPETSQSPARARSATSEDSQTLFVTSAAPTTTPHADHGRPPTPGSRQDPQTKTCWICIADASEDTPATSPWCSPCPCALVAHEACLLDWIADVESLHKTPRPDQGIGAPRLECPQCKAEIVVTRPRDYLVDLVRALERAAVKVVAPSTITFVGMGSYHASLMWGMHSIYAVFGADAGYRILRPVFANALRPPMEIYLDDPSAALQYISRIFRDRAVHWRLYLGLPLITPMLVLSRTRLADSVLPILPVLFFATSQNVATEPLDFTQWPPSASLCFAVLPYVRAGYNYYYDRVWLARMIGWMKELQPASTRDDADGEGEDEDEVRAGEFEVRIDGWDDWGEPAPAAQAVPPPPQQQQQAPPLAQPPLPDDDVAAPPPDIADHRARHQQRVDPQVDEPVNGDIPPVAAAPDPQPNARPAPAPAPALPAAAEAGAPGARRLVFSLLSAASTLLGAMVFPSLAGLSGDLLLALLPRVWTTALIASNPTPFSVAGVKFAGAVSWRKPYLGERWARSLVGGCLLVGVKDAVMLYALQELVDDFFTAAVPIGNYDLRNEVHPVFARFNFPDADYDALLPTLRLATLLLMSEGSLIHYATDLLVVPVRKDYRYPAGSGYEGQAYQAVYPHKHPLSATDKAKVEQELLGMANSVRFRREKPCGIGGVSLAGVCRPEEGSLVDSAMSPGFVGPPTDVGFNDEMSQELCEAHQQAKACGHASWQLCYNYFASAALLCHEIAHAVRDGKWGREQSCDIVVGGYDWEAAVFGGQTWPQRGLTDVLYLGEWPSSVKMIPYLRSGCQMFVCGQPPERAQRVWALPTDGVLQLCQAAFWSGLQDDGNALKVPWLVGYRRRPAVCSCRTCLSHNKWDGIDLRRATDLRKVPPSPNCIGLTAE
ncbi:hypothetical protein LTR53_004981 [Teratosphaeriaceae sp. CCFEE 6253]|nr:hypothetical protein LTR53_004981 [Teratosphaeriaceae sp. CCFEE 6253]